MTAEETIASLEAQLKQALKRLGQVTEQLRDAHIRITELEKQKMPAFVKADRKKPQEAQKKSRKKCDASFNHAHQRLAPTQIVEHHMVNCPPCELRLGGISRARVREVVDMPIPDLSLIAQTEPRSRDTTVCLRAGHLVDRIPLTPNEEER